MSAREPVNTDYIRQLAADLRESGREATAEDFEHCAAEIDALRARLNRLAQIGNNS